MKDHNDRRGGERDGKGEGEAPVFPMRLNRYLAMEGKGSRRDMDAVIRMGRVLINGRTASLGDKVSEGDKVEIRFKGLGERKAANRSGRNDGNNGGSLRSRGMGRKGKRW